MPDLIVPHALRSALREARHAVVLKGAGVSAESGIPTFRDRLTGLWERFDLGELASADAFRRDPDFVWGRYEWRRMKVLEAFPNPAHRTIAAWEQCLPRLTLVTQNVDDLHERAGRVAPIHLHGSLMLPRCFACARSYANPAGIPEEPEGGRRLPPPRCAHCGGRVRPGVVWFRETLPAEAWTSAREAAANCDLFFSIGTSALVAPASELALVAKRRGARIVQVNPLPTDLDGLADWNLRGAAGEVLPLLL